MVSPPDSESVPEIKGDLLLDRLTGWSIIALAIAVVVFSLVIPHKTTEGPLTLSLAFAHYRLLVLTVIGGVAILRSTRVGFLIAAGAFGLRVLIDTIELGIYRHDSFITRFVSTSWMFDLIMVGYVIFRLRAFNAQSP